jgi:hypothetical protein
MKVKETLEYEAAWEFANDFVGRWNAHDAAGILDLVTEDVHWQDPAMRAPAHGHAEAQEYIETLFRAFPDIQWAMPSALYLVPEDGESSGVIKIAQHWRSWGTHLGPLDPPGFAPTGQAFELQGADLWELDRSERRLRRVVSYYDGLGFARSVGIIPRPESVAERLTVRLQRLQARGQRRKATKARRGEA